MFTHSIMAEINRNGLGFNANSIEYVQQRIKLAQSFHDWYIIFLYTKSVHDHDPANTPFQKAEVDALGKMAQIANSFEQWKTVYSYSERVSLEFRSYAYNMLWRYSLSFEQKRWLLEQVNFLDEKIHILQSMPQVAYTFWEWGYIFEQSLVYNIASLPNQCLAKMELEAKTKEEWRIVYNSASENSALKNRAFDKLKELETS